MTITSENPIWSEQHRPRRVADTILPATLKETFQKFVDDGVVPNLLLTGKQGIGKTTVARAMLEELGCDYIVINGSMNGTIDTLRTDIANFASSVSLTGGRKYVVLDEADHLTPLVQASLRNFMEEFSRNCGFILTCNFVHRVIEPLHSRCSVVEFRIPKSEKQSLAVQFFKRACSILDTHGVPYEKAAVADLVSRFMPDWRRVISELQRRSATGRIDAAAVSAGTTDEAFSSLLDMMRAKRFTDIRKWVGENADIDPTTLFRTFYDRVADIVEPSHAPLLIMILSKYMYQSAFATDQEINTSAALAEVMVECELKK